MVSGRQLIRRDTETVREELRTSGVSVENNASTNIRLTNVIRQHNYNAEAVKAALSDDPQLWSIISSNMNYPAGVPPSAYKSKTLKAFLNGFSKLSVGNIVKPTVSIRGKFLAKKVCGGSSSRARLFQCVKLKLQKPLLPMLDQIVPILLEKIVSLTGSEGMTNWWKNSGVQKVGFAGCKVVDELVKAYTNQDHDFGKFSTLDTDLAPLVQTCITKAESHKVQVAFNEGRAEVEKALAATSYNAATVERYLKSQGSPADVLLSFAPKDVTVGHGLWYGPVDFKLLDKAGYPETQSAVSVAQKTLDSLLPSSVEEENDGFFFHKKATRMVRAASKILGQSPSGAYKMISSGCKSEKAKFDEEMKAVNDKIASGVVGIEDWKYDGAVHGTVFEVASTVMKAAVSYVNGDIQKLGLLKTLSIVHKKNQNVLSVFEALWSRFCDKIIEQVLGLAVSGCFKQGNDLLDSVEQWLFFAMTPSANAKIQRAADLLALNNSDEQAVLLDAPMNNSDDEEEDDMFDGEEDEEEGGQDLEGLVAASDLSEDDDYEPSDHGSDDEMEGER